MGQRQKACLASSPEFDPADCGATEEATLIYACRSSLLGLPDDDPSQDVPESSEKSGPRRSPQAGLRDTTRRWIPRDFLLGPSPHRGSIHPTSCPVVQRGPLASLTEVDQGTIDTGWDEAEAMRTLRGFAPLLDGEPSESQVPPQPFDCASRDSELSRRSSRPSETPIGHSRSGICPKRSSEAAIRQSMAESKPVWMAEGPNWGDGAWTDRADEESSFEWPANLIKEGPADTDWDIPSLIIPAPRIRRSGLEDIQPDVLKGVEALAPERIASHREVLFEERVASHTAKTVCLKQKKPVEQVPAANALPEKMAETPANVPAIAPRTSSKATRWMAIGAAVLGIGCGTLYGTYLRHSGELRPAEIKERVVVAARDAVTVSSAFVRKVPSLFRGHFANR